MYNYADDNTLFHASEHLDDVLQCLREDAETAVKWYKNNWMQANPQKFQFILSKTSQQNVSINIFDSVISSSDTVKLLGITFDSDLSFVSHLKDLCKRASAQLNVLRRFVSILSTENKMSIFHSFILSHFRYCPVVWHFCRKSSNDMIEKIQERALRFVYKDTRSSYNELLIRAKRRTMYHDRLYAMTIEVFKCLHGISPYYLRDMFSVKKCDYNLRDDFLLEQPKVNTVYNGLLTFRYHGAKIWNCLPSNVKSSSTLTEFKKALSSYLSDNNSHLCNCSFCAKCL